LPLDVSASELFTFNALNTVTLNQITDALMPDFKIPNS